MHRYQPRLHILLSDRHQGGEARAAQNFVSFIFPETQFTAVTAYQNHRVCDQVPKYSRNLHLLLVLQCRETGLEVS